MQYKISAFHSDELTLSLGDILRLLLGKTLKHGALQVKVKV